MFLYLSMQFIDFGCPLYKFGMRHGKEDPSLFFVTDTSKHCSLSEPHSTSVAVQICKSAYDVTLNDTDARHLYMFGEKFGNSVTETQGSLIPRLISSHQHAGGKSLVVQTVDFRCLK